MQKDLARTNEYSLILFASPQSPPGEASQIFSILANNSAWAVSYSSTSCSLSRAWNTFLIAEKSTIVFFSRCQAGLRTFFPQAKLGKSFFVPKCNLGTRGMAASAIRLLLRSASEGFAFAGIGQPLERSDMRRKATGKRAVQREDEIEGQSHDRGETQQQGRPDFG